MEIVYKKRVEVKQVVEKEFVLDLPHILREFANTRNGENDELREQFYKWLENEVPYTWLQYATLRNLGVPSHRCLSVGANNVRIREIRDYLDADNSE